MSIKRRSQKEKVSDEDGRSEKQRRRRERGEVKRKQKSRIIYFIYFLIFFLCTFFLFVLTFQRYIQFVTEEEVRTGIVNYPNRPTQTFVFSRLYPSLDTRKVMRAFLLTKQVCSLSSYFLLTPSHSAKNKKRERENKD